MGANDETQMAPVCRKIERVSKRSSETAVCVNLTIEVSMTNTLGTRVIKKTVDFAFSGKKAAYPILGAVLIVLLVTHLINWARNPESEYDGESY